MTNYYVNDSSKLEYRYSSYTTYDLFGIGFQIVIDEVQSINLYRSPNYTIVCYYLYDRYPDNSQFIDWR